MKKLFASLVSLGILAGSLAAAPEPASAATVVVRTGHHHRHQVCRVVWKTKVVWRHHRKHYVRYKVRQCRWVY
jgi:hypothetical protein